MNAAGTTVPPGAPGIAARWTSSAKSGVGTALSPACRIWFTISHGILNEVYYPRVDHACTRDLGLIVCGPRRLFLRREAPRQPCRYPVRGRRCRPTGWRTPRSTAAIASSSACWSIPYRPTCCRRSASRRSPAATRGLSGLRAAGAAPGQCRLRQHRLGRRLQGPRDAACDRQRRGVAGARLLAAVALRLAPAMSASPTAGSSSSRRRPPRARLPACRERQCRADRRDRLRRRPVRARVLRWASAPGLQEAAYNALASLHAGLRGRRAAAGRRLAAMAGQAAAARPRRRRPGSTATGSAPPCSPRIGRSRFRGRRSPACRSPGASARATRTSAAITWCGRATWSRPRAASSPPAPPTTRWRSSPICAPSRRPTATGRRTPGSTAPPTGPASRWTNAPSRSCSPRRCVAPATCSHAALRPFLPMIERAAAFVVRNGPVTGEDRWEEDAGYSPFTLAVEIAALLAAADLLDARGNAGGRPTICARPPTPGTTRSSAGPTSRAPSSAGSSASTATMCASRRPTIADAASPQGRLRADQEPAARGHRPAGRSRSSARTRWRWSASACRLPTTRASWTRSR